jgi:sugar phosphate isomerase/epimerase
MKCPIGVCEWSLPVNGPSAVALAAKSGFEGIQISDLGGAEQGYPLNNPAIREGYLQMAADYHVVLQSLHPYGLQRTGAMLQPVDTPRGRQGLEEMAHCIDVCAAMGIPNVMVSSFFATLVRNEWDFAVFADHLRHACRLGQEKGVRIVYESVLSVERLLRMLETVGENLTVCYDTLNPIRWGTGLPRQEIPQLAAHIDHFHVKDAPEDLKGYALIGEGRGDFAGAARAIRSIGYSGWLVSENYYTLLSAASGEDFIELAKRDIAAVRAAFAD